TEPARIELPTLHGETRRTREGMMIVVQLLTGDEEPPRDDVRRGRVGLEAAVSERMACPIDDAGRAERLSGDVHRDHDDAGHTEKRELRDDEENQAERRKAAV